MEDNNIAVPGSYLKTPKGHKWSQTQKLTRRYLGKYDKTGQDAWKEMGRRDGVFKEIKRDIRKHNKIVRNSWLNRQFNKKEKVLEIYNNFASGVTTVKHVDSETVVKEKTFTSKLDDGQIHDLSLDRHMFGNSELHPGSSDSWALCEKLSSEAYYDAVNLVVQALV